MKLENIINTARNGELKSLSAKDKTDGVVIDYINTAVVALYNRFVLRTVVAKLTPAGDKVLYSLDRLGVDVRDRTVVVDYNKKELNRVISVTDNLGNAYTINDDSDKATIRMPNYDSVVIPVEKPEGFAYYNVLISVVPVEVPLDADLSYNLDVPRFLLEAMMHYIGYRAHGSVDGNIQAENNTHLMRFVAACNAVEALGLIPTDNTVRSVAVKGFV